MKLKYANKIVTIIPITYQKDKVHYFNNKFVVMISRADHGKSVNWATIMYFQLVKKLIIWEKCHKSMIEGITKKEFKKDVCHSAIVFEVMFQKWCPLEGVESQKRKKHVEQPQEDKRRRNSMRERLIKNKRPLKPTHIFLKKERQPEARTTK
jgi:hypothetical protein